MLTDEQLKALGLDSPAPDVATPAPAAIPPIITQPPVQYPSSILGSKIPPEAMIPQTHEQGKEEFREYTPQITASPGTSDYFRQRQEQLNYKAEHPWGDPISAHPGVLGHILHGLSVAGNIAGDIVAPGTMSLIPGTQLHNAALARGNEQGILGAEKAKTEATTANAHQTEAGAEEKSAETNAQKLKDEEAAPTLPKITFAKTEDGSIVQLTADPNTGQAKASVLYHGDPKVETDLIERQVGNEQHTFLVNKKTGADIKDLGVKKVPGEPGSWTLAEGPNGTPVLFNSKTAQVKQAPPGIEAKGTAAAQKKQVQPVQDVLDEIAESREYAATPSATNDYGLLMNFIGVTKPESLAKLRLNQNEVALAKGTRGVLGDLKALEEKVGNGEMLTPNQRQEMLKTMGIVEKFAQRRLQEVGGGGESQSGEVKATHVYDPKTGTIKPVN